MFYNTVITFPCRPTVLDNFALISGQISTLNRYLKGDKTPTLRNYVLLPLVLAHEPDAELEVSLVLNIEYIHLLYIN